MLTAIFFLLTFATVAALVWGAMKLLTVEENPLGDRLQELQSSAMVSSAARLGARYAFEINTPQAAVHLYLATRLIFPT